MRSTILSSRLADNARKLEQQRRVLQARSLATPPAAIRTPFPSPARPGQADSFDARPARHTADPTHVVEAHPPAGNEGAPLADKPKGGAHDEVEHFENAEQAKEAGRALAERHIERSWGFRLPPWKAKVDVEGVTSELKAFLDEPSHSQAERAVVLASALEALPEGERREVAQALVDGMEPERLDEVGRSGIEALISALGNGRDTRVQRAVLEAELARRGPVQERIVNGVRIVGDEVSPEAMDAAAEQIERLMSENPELAAALKGTTVVISPDDENGTDQELVYESMGIHGNETGDGRLWDEVGGGASGKFLYLKEGDLIGSGARNTLNHEFTHVAHRQFLESLPADDPRLTALLDPGTEVSDVNGDGKITGADVIKIAWEQRKDSDRLSDDYSGVSEGEWLAQAGASYMGEDGRSRPVDAQWLKENDPALFELMQYLYGESPQLPPAAPPANLRAA